MQRAIIYCDGACLKNPGPGGWGAIIFTHTHVQEIGGHVAHTTNNQMEMRAALEALKICSLQSALILTDSRYLIDGISQWIHGWKKRGWTTAAGTPVANRELWLALDSITLHTEYRHIKGHAGNPGNERADTIASAYAAKKHISLFHNNADAYPHFNPQGLA